MLWSFSFPVESECLEYWHYFFKFPYIQFTFQPLQSCYHPWLKKKKPINFQTQRSCWSSLIWLITPFLKLLLSLALALCSFWSSSTFWAISSQPLLQTPPIHRQLVREFCRFYILNTSCIFPFYSFHTIVALAQIFIISYLYHCNSLQVGHAA